MVTDKRRHRKYRTTVTGADVEDVLSWTDTRAGVTRPLVRALALRTARGPLPPLVVDRILGVLVERGYVNRTGERRGTSYEITTAGRAVWDGPAGSGRVERVCGAIAEAVAAAKPPRAARPGRPTIPADLTIAFRTAVLAYLARSSASDWSRVGEVVEAVTLPEGWPVRAAARRGPQRPFGTPLDTPPVTVDPRRPTRTQVGRALAALVSAGLVEVRGVRAAARYRVKS